MKIPSSIRLLHEEQEELAERIADKVSGLFLAAKHPDWFYKGRVKGVESFAQKLETGRVSDPRSLEDVFACTIVVENRSAIADAVAMVQRFCTIVEQRPPVPGRTHKKPDAFPFDDLRLYVHLTPTDAIEPSPLESRIFEVQIKTFLQHAWAIATHDLIYKGSSIEWGKARIAYQIKAMLEHAEVSIEMADAISASGGLSRVDSNTELVQEVLRWLKDTWQEELLPTDSVRLAQTILEVVDAVGIKFNDLSDAVASDTRAGFGAALINLPPYSVVLLALVNHQRAAVERFLRKPRDYRNRRLLFIPELEIDEDLFDGANGARFIRPTHNPAVGRQEEAG